MAQIATARLETAAGTVDLPVFARGDSDSLKVREAVSVETPNGKGFIPITEKLSEAAHPYLRIGIEGGEVLAFDNQANRLTTLDDFNDGDVSDYSNSGANGFKAQTSTVFEGSHALVIEGSVTSDQGPWTKSISTNYDNGDTRYIRVRSNQSDADPWFLFEVENSSNWYGIQLNNMEDAELYKRETGSTREKVGGFGTVDSKAVSEWMIWKITSVGLEEFDLVIENEAGDVILEGTAVDNTIGAPSGDNIGFFKSSSRAEFYDIIQQD